LGFSGGVDGGVDGWEEEGESGGSFQFSVFSGESEGADFCEE